MDARTRRRFTLQLAPLLDLLFIVLYAQYIDLQDIARREIAQESERRHEAEQQKEEAAKLRTDALERLSDPALRAQQGAAARARACERFSWRSHCQALDRAIRAARDAHPDRH